MIRIFLSGGMHSDWQDIFINCYPKFKFFDPRSHGLTEPADYTKWNIEKVIMSDLVIAYFEKSNPSGLGTAVEIGIAVGSSVPIFFINENRDNKYTTMLEECAHKNFSSIPEALDLMDLIYRVNTGEDSLCAMKRYQMM